MNQRCSIPPFLWGVSLMLTYLTSPLLAQNPGALDTSFQPEGEYNRSILTVKAAPNNKILAVDYNGQLYRFNDDGTYDPTFENGRSIGAETFELIRQPDGKYLGCGWMQNGVVRFNEDGSHDSTFVGAANNAVINMALQDDGKIIIEGAFTSYGGVARNGVARINPDGSLDESFDINTRGKIAIQEDGKIIIAGYQNTATETSLFRYHPDGTLDDTFDTGSGTGINTFYDDIFIQEDGKILLAGRFNEYNGVSRNGIFRIHPDGSLDESFNPGTGFGFNSFPFDLAVDVDTQGRILITGNMTEYNGVSRVGLLRVNADGTLDTTFDPGTGFGTRFQAFDVAVLPNNKVVVVGYFFTYNGTDIKNIVQVHGGELDATTINTVRGQVFDENSTNCTFEEGDTPMFGWTIKAVSQDATYYSQTNREGRYTLNIPAGDYTLSVQPPPFHSASTSNTQRCPEENYSISLEGTGQDTTGFDFIFNQEACALLRVDVSANTRVRCFRSNTYINFGNVGSKAAEDVKIEVQFSEFLTPVESSIPWTSYDSETNTVVFALGEVAAGFQGRIRIRDSSNCVNAAFNATQCVEARITPKSTCVPPSENWSRADLEVTGKCVLLFDPISVFTIHNRGTGGMQEASGYRIYADSLLLYEGMVTLAPGDSLPLIVPTQGRSMRIEVDQVPFHPDNLQVSASIEGCGTTNTEVSRGFTNQFPQNDDNVDVEVDCRLIRGAFDPNDKLVSPEGLTQNHYVKPGTRMEYTIRFQNVGTAPAFNVRVLDTLSAEYDFTSFDMMSASHDYTLNIQTLDNGDQLLDWYFPDINLPDSTENEPESHGYIKFKVSPQDTMTEGTVVGNFADIYFDFNDPIRTNTTITTFQNYVFPTPETPTDPCVFVSVAKVGMAQSNCDTETMISADLPAYGKGYWTLVQGSGTIMHPNSSESMVNGLEVGDNVFRWHVSPEICPDNYQDLTITVKPTPDKPTVQNPEGNLLQSTIQGDRYQWYFDGALMANQTTKSFEATESGEYQVEVISDGCVSEISAVFVLEVTSLEATLTEVYGFNLHPNPSVKDLSVSFQRLPEGTMYFVLKSPEGAVLNTIQSNGRANQPWTATFATQPLPKGIYFLEVQTDRGSFTKKIIKQ